MKTKITHEEAVAFVRDKFGISDPVPTLENLDKIQRNFMSEMPFQNVSLLASPPEKRFPSIEEVISDGLALRGGSCILNNWFLYLLLKALRYDVYTIAATYCRVQELRDGHMMVVAKGLLDPEDSVCKEPLFLLDAASGFPLPYPVPLHRLPLSFPETAGLLVKMEMIDGLIYRLQHDKDPEPSEKYQMMDDWKVIIKFDLKPKDPQSLKDAMEAIFCPDPPAPLLREARMFRWPVGKNWCVAVRTYDLIFYGKECPEPDCKVNEKINKYKKTLNFEDLEDTIRKYFPMICHNQLRIALQKIKELKERENIKDMTDCENSNEGHPFNNNPPMIGKSNLAYEDAVAFVRDKLKVDDIEFASKSYEMLKKIQRHFLSEIPFQNITLISKPHKQRFPTIEDVLREGFSLGGGTCIDNNWFAYLILKALGYDAHAIAAIYCAHEDLEDLHMMVVVKGLQDPEDKNAKEPIFLVDIASGYPLPAPVPLHRLPIIYPETAGLELCFKRYGDYIYRMHKDKDVQPEEVHPSQDDWAVIMKFNLEPRDPASLRKGMEVSFLADPPGPFLQQTRLFRWPIGKEWAVAMRGTDLMFFGKECPEPLCHYDENKQKYKMTIMEDDLEITITKYFPMISQHQLKATIQIIQKYRRMKEESEGEEGRNAEQNIRSQECS